MNRIPLVVGVAGHIDIRPEDRETLRTAVREELENLLSRFPHTPVRMLSSLAAGADLLCADVAEETGIPLTAALPLDAEEYRKDFSQEDLEKLNHHLKRAEEVITVLPAETEPAEDNRDFRYRQAGIFVSEHCHMLVALWDGQEDNGGGCGTAAAVSFALQGAWAPVHGLPSRSETNTMVVHILAPRKGTPAEKAGEIYRLGDLPAWDEIMERTEEFNALAEVSSPEGMPLIPYGTEKDPAMEKLEAIYLAADALSLRFAKVYKQALASLALAGTVTTFAFLLYDNAELIPMILVCGAALLAAFFRCRQASRQACHRRFIEFRVLAETLRVQLFLRLAGSRLQVQQIMSRSQRKENAWILCAMCALNGTKPPEVQRDILEYWVKAQQDYHRQAGEKTLRRQVRNDRLLGIALRISVLLYLAVLVYEVLAGGLLFQPLLKLQDPETGRTLLKIVLGTISAGSLFLANYYGKMSLHRVTDDHEGMEQLHKKTADQIIRWGQNDNILETLAREELTENGYWSSYQRDNAPELNL